MISGCDTCVDDMLDKMKELQEPLKDHDLQTSTGESCICNQAQHKKGPFQWLEIYKRGSAQQWLEKGSVIWQL